MVYSPNKTVLSNPDHSLLTVIPPHQLLDQSLCVVAPNKQFGKWSKQDHADSFQFMQRITSIWKKIDVADQYMMYGKIDSKNPFNWEVVPYKKCRTFLGRMVQQLKVLWRTVFGGSEVSNKKSQKLYYRYEPLLKTPVANPASIPSKDKDSFCQDDVIERQWVITGNKVNVLFNYAPIGFGGEKLHFLVVPKEHREGFSDVTEEEYGESMSLTQKLVDHFSESRKVIKNVYLLNKSGIDAGQTVKHWHLHVIFSTNTAQDFWGKLTVVKNILFGSTPMKKDELKTKVGDLRNELKDLKI